MIKVIIFDFGGVLTYEGRFGSFCKKYAKEFNLTENEMHDIIHRYWNSARINKIKSSKFWDALSIEFKCDREKFRIKVMNHFKINHDMLKLIKSLKKKYKLVMLSDQIEDWLEEVIKKNKLNKIFDNIITSYNTRLVKPDIEIFKETIKRIKTKPDECIFIDDREVNVASAKKLGMRGIVFTNQSDLEKQLKEIL